MSMAISTSTVGLRFRTYADGEATRAIRAGHPSCPWGFALYHRELEP
ncbi:hypothetical protein [Conexivisphaera calida]|nr:hypothetical protein [Conexivisphaera calida]